MSNFGDVISILWALFGIMKHNINFLVLSTRFSKSVVTKLATSIRILRDSVLCRVTDCP